MGLKNNSEDLLATFTVDAILVRSPITFLSDSIKHNNVILGVIMAGSFIERFGVKQLEEYFEKKQIPYEFWKINRFSSGTIRQWLFELKLIDEELNCKIEKVCEHRNEVVHRKHPDTIDKVKTKEIIKIAIECLKELGAN